MCEGVGKTPSGAPGPDALLARLAEMTANLDAYVERRAAEIAADRIAEIERHAVAQLGEAARRLDAAQARLAELEAEPCRRIAALERHIERKGERAMPTTEEQLAAARADAERLTAEITRLRAALPPEPGAPGQRWRQGRTVPRNLYVHDGDHPDGHPVGQMPSARYAALVCAAVNARLRPRAADAEVERAIVRAINDPGAIVERGEESLAEWAARAVLAAIYLQGGALTDYGELSRAEDTLEAVRGLCGGDDPAVAVQEIRELLEGAP